VGPVWVASPQAYDFLVEKSADPDEQLAGLVPDPDSWLDAHWLIQELRSGPIPVIVDTSGLRTGLHFQLCQGRLPASLWSADRGDVRLYIERETLDEATDRISRFAAQFELPETDLQAKFADDWLPRMRVVDLPPALRSLDERACAVHARDPSDYPAAALAALLSPCILLTGDKDFNALGVLRTRQGTDAIVAAVGVKERENALSTVYMVPSAPVVVAGTGAKWAADRFGPLAWVVAVLIVAGAVMIYQYQPPERRQRLREGAKTAGRIYLEMANQAMAQLHAAEQALGGSAIGGPIQRTVASAVLRQLAVAPESMSAQQIRDGLPDELQPSVLPLRAFLHANKQSLVAEVRRGGFLLGHPPYRAAAGNGLHHAMVGVAGSQKDLEKSQHAEGKCAEP
jgi:predicted nucleic acid-binding protein